MPGRGVHSSRRGDYGYITLEAMIAGKAVITVEDAGGPLEFVHSSKKTAWLSDRSLLPSRIALQAMADDADLATRLGQAAHDDYQSRDIPVGASCRGDSRRETKARRRSV